MAVKDYNNSGTNGRGYVRNLNIQTYIYVNMYAIRNLVLPILTGIVAIFHD